MPQAKIKINGVDGSNDDLPINTLVQLDNHNTGGELTYTWVILDQPEGAADNLSATNIQNPTFTPKKEGTYLLKLIVNNTLPSQAVDQRVAAVRYMKTRERAPAANESTEDDATAGWKTAQNRIFKRLDNLYNTEAGIVVGVNASGGNISRGTVVQLFEQTTIKSGLPGQETLPNFTPADNSLGLGGGADPAFDCSLFIVEGGIDGAGTVANNGLIRVRLFGRFSGVTAFAPQAEGTPLFVSGDGNANIAPASQLPPLGVPRQVGLVISAGAVNPYDIWFDGTGRLQRPNVLHFGNKATPNAAGTTFLSVGFSSDTAPATEAALPAPVDGVVYFPRAHARVAPVGDSLVMTLRKNTIDQGPTVTLAAATTDAPPDNANMFLVAAGDRLSVKVVSGGAIATGAGDLVVSFLFLPFRPV